MDSVAFLERLASLTALSREFRGEIEDRLVPEVYRPHQIIHAAGQTETRLWYVVKGLVRTYELEQSGKEHTVYFFREQDLLFSYEGFWMQKTSLYIEVLEPSTLVALDYVQVNDWLNRFPEVRELAGIFMQHRYQQDQFRRWLMTQSAGERYRQLRKTDPELFRRVSVRLLATYLNMTRESLSRLMGQDWL